MLSILNRRVVATGLIARPLVRAYTIIPSMPSDPTSNRVPGGGAAAVTTTDEETYNSFHALYNNENQSIHETHLNPGQTYRSLSSDDHHSTFGPTFNSIFDE